MHENGAIRGQPGLPWENGVESVQILESICMVYHPSDSKGNACCHQRHAKIHGPRVQQGADAHRYISSNGLVSRKQLSHTSLTTLTACTSSLQLGRPFTERTALRRTQSC